MTFSDKSRYDRTFQKVTHKEEESEMNYINIFQNIQDLSVSVGNNYSKDQLIHIFLHNFHQGGKYPAQIGSHQSDIRRAEILLIKKSIYLILTE